MGVHSQYIRDALILYEDNKDQEQLIKMAVLIMRRSIFHQIWSSIFTSIAIQWATDHPSLARNGLDPAMPCWE